MHIRILAVGIKMPSWVEEGYQEYSKRFPRSCKLELIEIPPEKRTKQSDLLQLTAKEGEKILSLIKPDTHVIALDVRGKQWDTEELADNIKQWQQDGKNIDLLVGGPDGLSKACLDKANRKWSLSSLTFPHPLVRIILAEQLYRALMIIQGHPYHRS